MNILEGTCKCKRVKFQIDANSVRGIVNCHCNLCREMNGCAFSTYIAVLETGFTIMYGDSLKTYDISVDAKKCFCRDCGTPIYNTNPKYAGLKILYLGTIPAVKAIVPKANIYCESKLAWIDHLVTIDSYSKEKNN